MTTKDFPDPILVSRPDHLAELADQLLGEKSVAVDTESNSLYAFREQVCLVQFSTINADYLVDPLVLEDLSPLAGLFASEEVEKVFHAAEYDLICLKRDYGFQFANLFDTMIAARTLGRKEVGLGSILKAKYNVDLNKRYQRANWGQRPLPADLLAYARLDTHYLLPLHQTLYDDLVRSGRWELAAEDFKRLCQIQPRPAPESNSSPWKINGANGLDAKHMAVLQELCLFRERIARAKNWPLFKVISDQALYSIAEAAPRDRKALNQIPGVEWAARRYGDSLLKAVKLGLDSKPPVRPRSPRPDYAYLDRLESLRNWRKKEARRLGVDSDVILPKDLMAAIARRDPKTPAGLAQVMADAPERMERYGEGILGALEKN